MAKKGEFSEVSRGDSREVVIWCPACSAKRRLVGYVDRYRCRRCGTSVHIYRDDSGDINNVGLRGNGKI